MREWIMHGSDSTNGSVLEPMVRKLEY